MLDFLKYVIFPLKGTGGVFECARRNVCEGGIFEPGHK